MRAPGWLIEPAVAVGVLALGSAVWWTDYVTKNNTGEPGMLDLSGLEVIAAVARNTGLVLIPGLVWFGLAVFFGWLLRRRPAALRILAGLGASLALCLPIAIVSAISLTESDGWHGLGVIGVAFPLAGIFVMLVPQVIARVILFLAERPMRAR